MERPRPVPDAGSTLSLMTLTLMALGLVARRFSGQRADRARFQFQKRRQLFIRAHISSLPHARLHTHEITNSPPNSVYSPVA